MTKKKQQQQKKQEQKNKTDKSNNKKHESRQFTLVSIVSKLFACNSHTNMQYLP